MHPNFGALYNLPAANLCRMTLGPSTLQVNAGNARKYGQHPSQLGQEAYFTIIPRVIGKSLLTLIRTA